MLGLETRVATIAGLRVTEFVPGSMSPPAACIGVPDIDNYRLTMGRGKFQMEFTVTVFTSAAWDRTGQLLLAEYMRPTGANSMITAIEGDKTLGGIADDCWVTGFRRLGLEEVALIGYFGGEFSVNVVANGV